MINLVLRKLQVEVVFLSIGTLLKKGNIAALNVGLALILITSI